VAALERAGTLAPRSAAVAADQAAAYLAAGEPAKAERAARRALALEPGELLGRMRLARALAAQKRCKEAAREYAELIRARPERRAALAAEAGACGR
jgi:predicted Zn-dependent protease